MSTPDRGESKRRGLAIAGLAFGLAAPLAYMAQRLFDHVVIGPADPLSMMREAHVAFVWRSATAAFWGGLAALVALTLNGVRSRSLSVGSVAGTAAAIATAFLLFAWVLP